MLGLLLDRSEPMSNFSCALDRQQKKIKKEKKKDGVPHLSRTQAGEIESERNAQGYRVREPL